MKRTPKPCQARSADMRGAALAAIEILAAAEKLITAAGTCSPKPPGHDYVASINSAIERWQRELLKYAP